MRVFLSWSLEVFGGRAKETSRGAEQLLDSSSPLYALDFGAAARWPLTKGGESLKERADTQYSTAKAEQ